LIPAKIIKTINEQTMSTRAEVEARRGIVRDEQGRIIRSKVWLKERIKHLEAKKGDMKTRIKNIDAELKQRSAELKEAN
jgi:hypothetical protein